MRSHSTRPRTRSSAPASTAARTAAVWSMSSVPWLMRRTLRPGSVGAGGRSASVGAVRVATFNLLSGRSVTDGQVRAADLTRGGNSAGRRRRRAAGGRPCAGPVGRRRPDRAGGRGTGRGVEPVRAGRRRDTGRRLDRVDVGRRVAGRRTGVRHRDGVAAAGAVVAGTPVRAGAARDAAARARQPRADPRPRRAADRAGSRRAGPGRADDGDQRAPVVRAGLERPAAARHHPVGAVAAGAAAAARRPQPARRRAPAGHRLVAAGPGADVPVVATAGAVRPRARGHPDGRHRRAGAAAPGQRPLRPRGGPRVTGRRSSPAAGAAPSSARD